jgi:hypothetical protein
MTLMIAGAAGCDRSGPGPSASAGSRVVPGDSVAIPVAAAPRAPDTGAPVPPAIRDACADLHAVFSAVARAKGLAPPAVGPRDTTMTFGGFQDGVAERACYVRWTDSANDVAPGDLLGAAAARGWKERAHLLSADGPDGTVLAISRGGAACVFDMRWDGDDDSDSTYVPAPGFTAEASCFPDRPDRY